jgi:NADPH:quinone reductase-like Zn-dependent oxidoreductase
VILPHISGCDIAGEVAEAGAEVDGVTRGSTVLVAPGLSCGRCSFCQAGEENYCAEFGIIGYRSPGGYAELVAVPARNLLAYPDGVPWEEAAAFPLVFLTAWRMLTDRAKAKAGERVLVLAAGSGVGMAAVQVAKLLGCEVIATAGSAEKLAKAQRLGADHVINHRTQNITDEVKRMTDGKGVDVVVEHVGDAVWDACVRSLGRGGRLVTCGATTGYQGVIDLRYLYSRQLSILGSYMGNRRNLETALGFLRRGQLRSIVDSTYALADAMEAQRRLESGAHFGKIVLRVPT